ncbi:MAG: enoyl-CoA hydratase/isomerase family protein [Flavobacteriales bacterium]|nr:enoyl-CoA hydratase/isomerase family protein [Flavobacteriales bacterium]MCB9336337.1 enoyl-CoA hydratase/isomerase family protein [Flavobacteriales bacterium]
MEYSNVLVEIADKIAVVTINRPNQLNALNKETIAELSKVFKSLETNPEARAIIITGSGEKAFVAGADIKEFFQFDVAQGKELSALGHKTLFDLVENLTTPVIGAINGFALGGGLELAMSCHFRIASDNAKLGLPEVTLGVIPGYGGTQRLSQLAGKGRAMEMIMTAKMISAEEALNYGLVNNVVTQDELLNTCKSVALKIVKNSSTAISSAIKAVNAGFKDGVNGFEVEIEEFGKCFGTQDFVEGTTAFIEKRKPNF